MDNFSKSEKEIYDLRKQKISFLNELASNSFPTKFNESVKVADVIKEHSEIKDGEHTGVNVSIRGRILNARSFGKLLFYDLLDQSGKIQLLINSGEIDELYFCLLYTSDAADE